MCIRVLHSGLGRLLGLLLILPLFLPCAQAVVPVCLAHLLDPAQMMQLEAETLTLTRLRLSDAGLDPVAAEAALRRERVFTTPHQGLYEYLSYRRGEFDHRSRVVVLLAEGDTVESLLGEILGQLQGRADYSPASAGEFLQAVTGQDFLLEIHELSGARQASPGVQEFARVLRLALVRNVGISVLVKTQVSLGASVFSDALLRKKKS